VLSVVTGGHETGGALEQNWEGAWPGRKTASADTCALSYLASQTKVWIRYEHRTGMMMLFLLKSLSIDVAPNAAR